jgi:putative transposase
MAKKKAPIPAAQKALIDQLIRESGGPQALFDKGGLLDQLKKRFIEQALEAEMDEHLGYPKLFCLSWKWRIGSVELVG